MAFSQSIQKGQAPICCNLCETETKITTKCIDCDLLMCTKCCDKVHPKFKNAKDHKIVDIKDIGMYTQEMDFTNIKCQDHTGQNCCLFCESCDQLVCPLCISKTHNGHGLIEISKSYEIKLDKLKEAQVTFQSNFQKLKKHKLYIKEIQKTEREQYIDTKEKIQAQNIALKTEVDELTECVEKELEQKMSLHRKSIEKEQSKSQQLKKKVEDQLSTIGDMIDAKDAARVFTCSNEIIKSTFEVMEEPELNIRKFPTFCSGQMDEEVLGSLQDKLSIKMTISEQFVTGFTRIDKISVCSDDSIWIRCYENSEDLHKVKPEEGDLKDIQRIEEFVYDMAIDTESQDLLLSTANSTFQVVNYKTGLTTRTIFTVSPLLSTCVHVTKSNKVIVGAASEKSFNPERSCVITMNATGDHEALYEFDKNNTPIFNLPWRIKSTINGRICILDRLSGDGNGRIVILNQKGDVIQIYKGHPKINSPDKLFKPKDLAVTPLDNIIITNLNINTFHILNSSGHFITHYDTTDVGIIYPLSLCFSTKGLLYIGSATRKGSNDKAKIYIVNISEN